MGRWDAWVSESPCAVVIASFELLPTPQTSPKHHQTWPRSRTETAKRSPRATPTSRRYLFLCCFLPKTHRLAQAFQDLARGEQTAAALENHLDKIEKQIEALLAAADEARESPKQQGDAGGSSQGGQGSSSTEASQGPGS